MQAKPVNLNDAKPNNRVCPHTIAFMLDNPLRRLIQNPARIVGPYIKPGDTVIDLGCGPGFLTIDMAKMVGPTGKVIAVDLQSQMLDHVRRKALKKNVSARMVYHQCGPHRLELSTKADFCLAFYMVHETPEPDAFFKEIRTLLNPSGLFLIVEPRFHVKKGEFEDMVDLAEQNGFQVVDRPKRKGGHCVLLA
jgi:ubiquinone/menaquinone biosynthesis C-methylase UbiE